MKSLLIVTVLLLISLCPMASEKLYYVNNGWTPYDSELAKIDGKFVDTPNGPLLCEVTILKDGDPIPFDYLAVDTDGKIVCPAKIDEGRKAIVNAEHQAKLQTVADRKSENIKIRAMISNVNDSNLKPWFKRLLRRLIKDMKD